MPDFDDQGTAESAPSPFLFLRVFQLKFQETLLHELIG
jgi:hypothetical protein